ncbi:hypothetical protein ILYODFUR_019564 [Ilyodon furcidens]|uniref:Uncharacterized protein n=1 Tax=Ilyodon furcidens TaxID=33524 RepID=A0ABV0SYG6_9TELE
MCYSIMSEDPATWYPQKTYPLLSSRFLIFMPLNFFYTQQACVLHYRRQKTYTYCLKDRYGHFPQQELFLTSDCTCCQSRLGCICCPFFCWFDILLQVSLSVGTQ